MAPQAAQSRTGPILNLSGGTDLSRQLGNQAAQVGDLSAGQAGERWKLPAGRLQRLAAGASHLSQVEDLPDFGRIQDRALHLSPAEDRVDIDHSAEPHGLPGFKHLQALPHHPELLAHLSQVPGGGQRVKPPGSQGTVGKPGDDPLQVLIVQHIQVGKGH